MNMGYCRYDTERGKPWDSKKHRKASKRVFKYSGRYNCPRWIQTEMSRRYFVKTLQCKISHSYVSTEEKANGQMVRVILTGAPQDANAF
jgi:hypothetical protein